MSTVPLPPQRHALGLPAGSIRATHTLFIVGLFCAQLLVPTKQVLPIPPYMLYLLFMVLGHYFAHRPTAGSVHNPLYIPGWFIRFVIIVAMVGTIGWSVYSEPDRLRQQFELSLDALKQEPLLPLVILGAFFLGVIVRMIVGHENPPYALQDMEAWLSLISIVGLSVAVVYHLIIVPSLEAPATIAPVPVWQAVLAGVIAFYFGERS